MNDNALYFPYISVPDNDWTIKTLLYWDKLSSIVPREFIRNPERLNPFMRQLVQEELVQQVMPHQYLRKIKDFDESFINLIEQNIEEYKNKPGRNSRVHVEKVGPYAHVHAEKMGNIPEFLVSVGLASSAEQGWYNINKKVANLFMAYIALCLAALDDINAVAVTNKAQYTRLFNDLNPSRQRRNVKHHSKARDVILQNLLPVPNEAVTLDQLLRFKSDHGHLLPSLRLKVEDHCANVATLPSSEDRVISTKSFLYESLQDVQEITDAMKPTWSKITFGSIAPLFGAGIMLHTPDNAIEYAGAAITFTAATYQAISSIRGNKNKMLNRPLAYVAHANSGIYA